MPSLFVIQGRDQGKRFELQGSCVRVGREKGNTVQLHDTEVSRFHAELREQGGRYELVDLGSSNGTYVNIQLIDHHLLNSGDRVQVGRTLMIFTAGDELTSHERVDSISIVGQEQHPGGSRIVSTLGQQPGDGGGLAGAGSTDDHDEPSVDPGARGGELVAVDPAGVVGGGEQFGHDVGTIEVERRRPGIDGGGAGRPSPDLAGQELLERVVTGQVQRAPVEHQRPPTVEVERGPAHVADEGAGGQGRDPPIGPGPGQVGHRGPVVVGIRVRLLDRGPGRTGDVVEIDAHGPLSRGAHGEGGGEHDLGRWCRQAGPVEGGEGGREVHVGPVEHPGGDERAEVVDRLGNGRADGGHARGRRGGAAHGRSPAISALSSITSFVGTSQVNTPATSPSCTGVSGPTMPRTNR